MAFNGYLWAREYIYTIVYIYVLYRRDTIIGPDVVCPLGIIGPYPCRDPVCLPSPTTASRYLRPMAPPKRKSLAAPGTPLQNTLVLPYSPAIRRLISRLSKDSLLVLVLTWLDATRVQTYKPNLTSEDDDEEDLTLDSVREVYESYKTSRGVKGKDVVERIVEREWKSGLNLIQIAELDYQCLCSSQSHPAPPPQLTIFRPPRPSIYPQMDCRHPSPPQPLPHLHFKLPPHPAFPRLRFHPRPAIPHSPDGYSTLFCHPSPHPPSHHPPHAVTLLLRHRLRSRTPSPQAYLLPGIPHQRPRLPLP